MHTDALPLLKADEYPGGLWYYEPHNTSLIAFFLAGLARPRWFGCA